MHWKALLFDVDGTLADTERDGHRPAFNQAFKEFGLNWEWDVSLYGELLQVTGGKERMHFYAQRYQPQALRQPGFEELVRQLHQTKTRLYMQRLQQGGIPLRPGVQRLLQEARAQGVRLAVATTTTLENVTTLLEQTLGRAALDWFQVMAAGDIVPAKKPAPDIYLWALDRLGLSARDCLAFEDSENGLKAARAAQLATVITVNDYTRDQDFTGAIAVLSDLGEPNAPCHAMATPGKPSVLPTPHHGVVDLSWLEGLQAESPAT